MSRKQKTLCLVVLLMLVSCSSSVKKDSSAVKNDLWEEVSEYTYRMRVPTGWVVKTYRGCCFVPDPQHEWKLSEVKK